MTEIRLRLVVASVSPSLPAMLDWLDDQPEIESNTDVMKAWVAAWRACERHHGIAPEGGAS